MTYSTMYMYSVTITENITIQYSSCSEHYSTVLCGIKCYKTCTVLELGHTLQCTCIYIIIYIYEIYLITRFIIGAPLSMSDTATFTAGTPVGS